MNVSSVHPHDDPPSGALRDSSSGSRRSINDHEKLQKATRKLFTSSSSSECDDNGYQYNKLRENVITRGSTAAAAAAAATVVAAAAVLQQQQQQQGEYPPLSTPPKTYTSHADITTNERIFTRSQRKVRQNTLSYRDAFLSSSSSSNDEESHIKGFFAKKISGITPMVNSDLSVRPKVRHHHYHKDIACKPKGITTAQMFVSSGAKTMALSEEHSVLPPVSKVGNKVKSFGQSHVQHKIRKQCRGPSKSCAANMLPSTKTATGTGAHRAVHANTGTLREQSSSDRVTDAPHASDASGNSVFSGNSCASSSSRAPAAPGTKRGGKCGNIRKNVSISGTTCISTGLSGNSGASTSCAPAAPGTKRVAKDGKMGNNASISRTDCSASLSGNSGASSSRAPAAPVTKTGTKICQMENNAPISGKACSAGLLGNSGASSSRAPAAPEDGNTRKITPKLCKTGAKIGQMGKMHLFLVQPVVQVFQEILLHHLAMHQLHLASKEELKMAKWAIMNLFLIQTVVPVYQEILVHHQVVHQLHLSPKQELKLAK